MGCISKNKYEKNIFTKIYTRIKTKLSSPARIIKLKSVRLQPENLKQKKGTN